MKKIKNIFIITILLTASNCGFINSWYLMGNSFVQIFPSKHRVTKEIEDNLPTNGLAIVSLNFRANNQKDGISTMWRRIDKEGVYGKRIALTNFDLFKRGRVRAAIKPGTYFLDGFRHSDGRRYFVAGIYTKMYSNRQMGWNEQEDKPLYFSFKAEAGKDLKVPDVFLFANCKSGSSNCSKWDIEFSMFIEKDLDDNNNKYQTGLNIKKLDEYPLK